MQTLNRRLLAHVVAPLARKSWAERPHGLEGPAGVRNPSSAQLDVRWAARRTPPLIAMVHLGDQIAEVSYIAENKKHICHLR